MDFIPVFFKVIIMIPIDSTIGKYNTKKLTKQSELLLPLIKVEFELVDRVTKMEKKCLLLLSFSAGNRVDRINVASLLFGEEVIEIFVSISITHSAHSWNFANDFDQTEAAVISVCILNCWHKLSRRQIV